MAPDDEAADEVEPAAEPAASVESAVDEAAVVALLEERGQAKQAKDYEKADEIADTLRSDFNVAVADRSGARGGVVSLVRGLLSRRGGRRLHRSRWATSSCAAPPTKSSASTPRPTRCGSAGAAMGIVLDTRARTWKKYDERRDAPLAAPSAVAAPRRRPPPRRRAWRWPASAVRRR